MTHRYEEIRCGNDQCRTSYPVEIEWITGRWRFPLSTCCPRCYRMPEAGEASVFEPPAVAP